jgi:hypothetical protein
MKTKRNRKGMKNRKLTMKSQKRKNKRQKIKNNDIKNDENLKNHIMRFDKLSSFNI